MDSRLVTLSIITLLLLSCTLANTPMFGMQSITAYFGFTICALASAAVFGVYFVVNKRAYITEIVPPHILIFLVLGLYVFVHGSIVHSIELDNYYWVTSAFFLVGISYYTAAIRDGRLKKYAFIIIVFSAFVESVIVLLQSLHVIASKNPLFPCTGTWINPNVTAMFLSMSLYAFFTLIRLYKARPFLYTVLIFMIIAIVLLQCRTAYIVGLFFISANYGPYLADFFKQKFGINRNNLIAITGFLTILFFVFISFSIKRSSTEGRLQIWKNSIQLIAEKPVFGYGFGHFEKDYNRFVADNGLLSRGHVNMPYNDFLELAIEGGLVAVALWIAFLFALIRYYIRNGLSLIPIIAFIIIEFINFGIQAIPAFVLFLVYIGIDSVPISSRSEGRISRPSSRVSACLFSLVVITLFIQQASLAKAFYTKNVIAKTFASSDAIEAYEKLKPALNDYAVYHEDYGDAYIKAKRIDLALQQYRFALRTSSTPDILTKCGSCYMYQNNYDSSIYFYKLVQNMEPYKISPLMSMLKLYQRKGDMSNVIRTAREIVDMPVKIENEKSTKIRVYAMSLLNKQQ